MHIFMGYAYFNYGCEILFNILNLETFISIALVILEKLIENLEILGILQENFQNFLFFDLGGEPISGGEVGGSGPTNLPSEPSGTEPSPSGGEGGSEPPKISKKDLYIGFFFAFVYYY
jgi:hypothetical protein